MNTSPDITVSAQYVIQLRQEVADLRGRLYMVRQALNTSDTVNPTNATHNTFWGGIDAMRDRVSDALTRDPVEREPETRGGAQTYFETMRAMHGNDERLMRAVDAAESRLNDDKEKPGHYVSGSARPRRHGRMWFNRWNQ